MSGAASRLKNVSIRIGVETETTVQAEDFYDIVDCYEFCSVCEICKFYNDFCERCDSETFTKIVKIYIKKTGIKNEDVEHEKVCEFCKKHTIYKEVICSLCNPCEGCSSREEVITANINEDHVIDFFDINDIGDFVERVYFDCSCGLEICSRVFHIFADFRKYVKRLSSAIGQECMHPSERCGGHVNISWFAADFESWEKYEKTIAKNALDLAPLLIYLFEREDLTERAEYIENLDFDDKYSPVHLKYYAVEFRLFSAPIYPEAYALGALTAAAITLKRKRVLLPEQVDAELMDYYDARLNYENVIECDKAHINALNAAFSWFIRNYGEEIKIASEWAGVNLRKALLTYKKHYIRKPEKFSLEPFIKRISYNQHVIAAKNATLTDFGIV